ncbi:MAG TPA: NADH-quinone oxidoreductase subunit A [Pirellulales bacterium]|jgi:NADH-quinone oxidoreductase subunit A|nr:NADH-quinone oxidoreductase subunit A [Pirellulales bacterium]
MSPTAIVAYLALFTAVGFVFLFVNLLVGKFLRPKAPNPEKLAVYECGEPTIGSSFVQFDLRFYVVALLFIIFDVEVAFFFPWATVFGKATHLMDPRFDKVTVVSGSPELTPAAKEIYRQLGDPNATVPDPQGGKIANNAAIEESARTLAWASILDILVFFGVLMVGFAYVWRRGDLDWVRAVSEERALRVRGEPPTITEEQPALAG